MPSWSCEMPEEPFVYSISFRMRRTTVEESFIKIPVTSDIMSDVPDANGHLHIDSQKFAAAALAHAQLPEVDWHLESRTRHRSPPDPKGTTRFGMMPPLPRPFQTLQTNPRMLTGPPSFSARPGIPEFRCRVTIDLGHYPSSPPAGSRAIRTSPYPPAHRF